MSRDYMLREIGEQPVALERTAARVAAFFRESRISLQVGGRILLVGCGDMNFSARAAAALTRRAFPEKAIPISACTSMEMRWEAEALTSRDLVIVSSFSGRTPRTIEAALLARKRGARVVAVTGNLESPLAAEGEDIVFLETGPRERLEKHAYAGYHFNVPQTVTYSAALLAELLLTARLAGLPDEWTTSLQGIPAHMKTLLESLPEKVGQWVDASFGGQERIVVLASGPWRPAAMYGAAKFLEMSISSCHQCLEEFNHLELFLTGTESLVIFLSPDKASWIRAEELIDSYKKLGSNRLAIVNDSLVPDSRAGGPDLLPIPGLDNVQLFFASILALQLLAVRIGRALGRDIDQWVGGVRTGLIENLSQSTIRGSTVRSEGFGD